MSARIALFRDGAIVAYARIDAEDRERIAAHRWHLDSNGRPRRSARICGRRTNVYLRREILCLPHGVGVSAGVVVNVNGDVLDCRKTNLTCTSTSTRAQRAAHPRREPGPRGVRYDPQSRLRPYRAAIRVDGVLRHLGNFARRSDAARAYDAAARAQHGVAARLNGART